MFPTSRHEVLGPDIHRPVVRAPDVARRHQAGQFVIVWPTADSERIPLTVANSNRSIGAIELIVEVAGKSTAMLCALRVTKSLQKIKKSWPGIRRPIYCKKIGCPRSCESGTAVIW